MEAAECVVCHRSLDPVAGLFQDYWRFADQGVYGRRKGGWFADMFAAGFEGETLPPDERWRSLQWLGERTANDPELYLDMDFLPDDVQLLKNSVILHKRTAYEDFAEPERRRHLVRLWLTAVDFADGDEQLRRGITLE